MATLYIIPTPIGNIDDITIRAKKILTETEVILAEDTRVTKKLLKLLEIEYTDKKIISNHEHNERKQLEDVINLLVTGHDSALVTDAGTPLLSDPGFPLIRAIRSRQKEDSNIDIKIEVLPGASSITTALVSSGFPTDKFTFLGYFPRKPSDKKKLLGSVRKSNEHLKVTYVGFETRHRLLATLNMMMEILGKNIDVCLCKELTKMHETVEFDKVNNMIYRVEKGAINLKGEFVIVFNLNLKDNG